MFRILSSALTLFLICNQGMTGLQIQFDYQYDSGGFFDAPERKTALETAANLVNRYVDNLLEISPDENNSWTTIISKPDGSGTVAIDDIPIPEDTVVIYVAGLDLRGRLAQAIDFGGLGTGTPEFNSAVETRGQIGTKANPATDFGPLGGTISFNSNVDEVRWHFGLGTQRLHFNRFDFITVAAHEIIHLLGLGTAKSFRDHTNRAGQFQGTNAVAVGSANNPNLLLEPDEGHWRSNTNSEWNGTAQKALLSPGIAPGQRQMPTLLDRAALLDIGWEPAIAGDATRDRVFNTTDLVTVFTAGKYETGVLAGWADGDFNDDGEFGSGDLIDALATGTYEFEANPENALLNDSDSIRFLFDESSGQLTMDTNGNTLTTLELKSAAEQFNPDGMTLLLDGIFDVQRDDKIFIMNPSGFGDLEFGSIVDPGTRLDAFLADVSVNGTFLGGGRIANLEFVSVPESNSFAYVVFLSCAAVLPLLRRR